MTSREHLLARTFVDLADTLVDEFDAVDLLHTLAERSTELLDASAAGIMLADQRGELHVMASSTEEARLLELFELQRAEGPCLDCFRSGRQVTRADLPAMRASWPAFTDRLEQLGFGSAQALPMRLRDATIGVLNLFRAEPAPLSESDLWIGQAMAHVATVALIHEQAIAEREVLAEQLQTALNSRVLLEQATGVLAERAGASMDEAFQAMRRYARGHNTRLRQVATEIIDGTLGADLLRR